MSEQQEDRAARLACVKNGLAEAPAQLEHDAAGLRDYRSDVMWLFTQLDEALDVVADLTAQGCTTRAEDGPLVLDSSASGAYSEAIRFLAEWGRVEITEELSPRWIRAKWKMDA